MRVGDPGSRESFLVVAATFLVGVAFALATFTPPLNSMENRLAEDHRARNSSGFGLYECGVYSNAVLNARRRLPKRAILVIVENSDPIPFRTDPRLDEWTKAGVSFPAAVRVSNEITADIAALTNGFGMQRIPSQNRRSPETGAMRSVSGWQHGRWRVAENLFDPGFETALFVSGYMTGWGMNYGSAVASSSLDVRALLECIRVGDLITDLTYFEYRASELDTIELLTTLSKSLVASDEWNQSLIAIAAIPKDDEDEHSIGISHPFSLFIKFPRSEFAAKSCAITVSSYDVGNTFREYFGEPIAMDSIPMMLRDETKHRSRFVFGGTNRGGLTWVRAGRFEYDIARRVVIETTADVKHERDSSESAREFELQAARVVDAWPNWIDSSLFRSNSNTIEGLWAYSVTPVDPFAGNPTHFIYK